MSLVRGSVAAVFVVVCLLASGGAAYAQNLISTEVDRSSISLPRCGELAPHQLRDGEDLRSSREIYNTKDSCDGLAFESGARAARRDDRVTPRAEKDSEDRVQVELTMMGAPGITIANAREAVLKIFEENGACAAWFRQKEPDPGPAFREVHFRLDENGSKDVLKLQEKSGEWFYREPYAAKVIQNASRPATVTINSRGAFFQLREMVRIFFADGTPGGMSAPKMLDIDLYPGGTLEAEITILLHEFAHAIDIIPIDSSSTVDSGRSVQNTAKVLHYCRAEVESAAKRERRLIARPDEAFSNLWKH